MNTDPTTEPLDDPDVPVFLDDPDLRLPRLPMMVSEEILDEFREKFSAIYPSTPSETPKKAEPRTPRKPAPLKTKDARPKLLDFSGEPIYRRKSGSCWPLPRTISHTPSDKPLDMKFLDTLVPTRLQKEKKENS
jgi:hypothetical protein